jgi:hypothetical protein
LVELVVGVLNNFPPNPVAATPGHPGKLLLLGVAGRGSCNLHLLVLVKVPEFVALLRRGKVGEMRRMREMRRIGRVSPCPL